MPSTGTGPPVCYTCAVPRFSPFPGLRFDPTRHDLATVTAPPYDVIDDAGRAALAASDPHNVVRLDLPSGDDCYTEAGRCLDRWIAEGVLVRDEPVFYGYRMSWDDVDTGPGSTTGVLGALELSRPGEGGILPHEQTTKKAKTDRLDLLRGARANLSAVWGLSPAVGLAALCEPAEDADVWEWADADGVVHVLWVIDDPVVMGRIADVVASDAVVIADGHHRYETSLAYRDERVAGDGDAGDAAAALVYLVELSEDQLRVGPIHRLVDGLPEGFDLLRALEPFFDVSTGPVPATVREMEAAGVMVLVLTDRRVALRPRDGAFEGVRDLDTSRLDAALADLPPHTLTYQHGVDAIAAKVAAGEAQAGVLMRPATVGQILEIAHGGERMPPKTTFFWPKPRTGAVFRTL